MVEILTHCIKEAAPSPRTPPKAPSSRDSIKKAARMLFLGNPRARKVPISTVRLATAAYMVTIAPIMAPKEKIMVIDNPRMRIKRAIISD